MRLETKRDYQKLLMEILDPLRKKFSVEGARIRLNGAGAGYLKDAIEMEAFARPLWGLVPYWAGGGYDGELEEQYRKGIAAGTNPEASEYWGVCSDCDQRFVEMAPIALGLLLVPQVLWIPLSEEAKEHLAVWLSQINDHELPKCNWYYFRILVNLALRELGRPYSETRLEEDLAYMESCYLGDGWYVDGVSEQKDYYSAFAMQFYGLLYAVYGGDRRRGEEYREHARLFSKDYIYWFDENGAALPFGRSLIYRFAQTAFWSAAVLADASAWEAGIVKGVINRNLRYWLSQEIFAGDKTLTVGYAYPNLTMAERYNAPGSPYWCLKTFLVLALPDSHPYWKVREEPLPVLDAVHAIQKADMLIEHRGTGVTAYVPGVYNKNTLGHFTEKYAKFAYSTRFGFSVSHSSELITEAAPDSMLAFVPDGEPWVCVRRRSIRYEIEPHAIRSEWSPMEGVKVVTEIRPFEWGHIRTHRITSSRSCTVYDCGFAVGISTGGREGEDKGETVRTDDYWIEVRNREMGCRVASMTRNLKPYLIEADPNTSLLYKNTRIPALTGRITPGETVFGTLVETF